MTATVVLMVPEWLLEVSSLGVCAVAVIGLAVRLRQAVAR